MTTVCLAKLHPGTRRCTCFEQGHGNIQEAISCKANVLAEDAVALKVDQALQVNLRESLHSLLDVVPVRGAWWRGPQLKDSSQGRIRMGHPQLKSLPHSRFDCRCKLLLLLENLGVLTRSVSRMSCEEMVPTMATLDARSAHWATSGSWIVCMFEPVPDCASSRSGSGACSPSAAFSLPWIPTQSLV